MVDIYLSPDTLTAPPILIPFTVQEAFSRRYSTSIKILEVNFYIYFFGKVRDIFTIFKWEQLKGITLSYKAINKKLPIVCFSWSAIKVSPP